jgi:hypothetical protein
VYDRSSAKCVQSLPLQLFPTQQLLLADDAGGRCVVAAVRRRLVCLVPVPLEEQVRQQLRAKQYEEAVSLACSAVALSGMPQAWTGEMVLPLPVCELSFGGNIDASA